MANSKDFETYIKIGGKVDASLKNATNSAKNQLSGIQKAGMAMAGVTAVVTAIGVGVWGLAKKTTEAGDRIDELSQTLGMSRRGFQEWEYVLNQSGVEMEDLKMNMKTLATNIMAANKHGKKASPIFRNMGVAIKNNNGTLRSQEEIFNDTIKALQKMPEGVEKAALATTLFGKSGRNLLPVLNAQAGSLDELKKKAQKLGIILSDDVINNAAKMDDTMKDAERTFGALGMVIGAYAMPALQRLTQTIIENMPQIMQAMKIVTWAFDDFFTRISNIYNFVKTNFIPIVSILAGVGGMMALHKSFIIVKGAIELFRYQQILAATSTGILASIMQGNLINALKLSATAIWAQTAALLANPWTWVAVGIAAVVAATLYLITNWDAVKAKCTEVWNSVVVKIQQAWTLIKPILDKIGNAMKMAFNFTPIGMAITAGKAIAGAVQNKNQGKPIQKHARGTASFRGGPTWVGEKGPEIVDDIPRGASIYSNQRSKALLGGGSNGSGIKVDIVIQGNADADSIRESANSAFGDFKKKCDAYFASKKRLGYIH